ncbi:MAG: 16S rRNA (cytosine(967)-C(5))-methyltransferase RsmB [Verrucomicrobiia bacterium]
MVLKKPREIALKILNETSEAENRRPLPNSEHFDNEIVTDTESIASPANLKHQFIEERLAETLRTTPLTDADRRLIWELCLGIKKWQLTLDWLISQKTKIPPRHHSLANILRLGIYQIIFLSKIPDHAAVNESVELAKKYEKLEFVGLVNAVLRGFTREKEKFKELIKETKKTQPHIGYSHPEWLYNHWKNGFGEENAIKLLKWNNIPAKTYARLNTLLVSAEALLNKWAEEKVRYKPVLFQWTGENLVYELKSHPPLWQLETLQKGWFYIQDPSTLLAVKLLEPKEGDKILDFCAAPGGKTTFIAQLIRNNGLILAHDTNLHRLELLKENLDRLGVKCCRVVDSRMSGEIEFNAPYDRILVDVPCSNTGVMRRRVELRWRLKPQKFKELQGLQLEILSKAATYLKRGGTLVYSTCSIEAEENSQVVEKFLAQNRGWRLDIQKSLYPFADGVDGAYAARLIREV